MNILVTGGTGFIGMALAIRLLKDRHKVTILTRDEKKVSSSLNGKVNVLEIDISDQASLERLDAGLQQVDAIFHLAASLDYFGDRNKLYNANVEGTINLLRLGIKNRIKKFIFTSSIEAMGTVEDNEIPADEESVCRPVSPYGGSKLAAERKVIEIAEERDLDISIFRLGNVYGPGSFSFIIPVAKAIIENGDLLKYLSFYGNRYIHPVYIEDVVEGILRMLQINENGVFILAGMNYITISELFGLVSENLGLIIKHVEGSLADRVCINLRTFCQKRQNRADLITYFLAGKGRKIHRAYSIEKAKKELGYVPKTNLRDGIAKTLKWANQEGLFGER